MLKNNLILLRRSRGWTQLHIASMMDIDVKRYASWEEGRCEPRSAHLLVLSNIFNLTINQMLEVDYSSPASIIIEREVSHGGS